MSKRFEWTDHQCNRWCKVHYYYDFELGEHFPLPTSYNIFTSTHGWMERYVFTGPLAYYPKRPTADQWAGIRMTCPHGQKDITCNTCHRHEFRPFTLDEIHR